MEIKAICHRGAVFLVINEFASHGDKQTFHRGPVFLVVKMVSFCMALEDVMGKFVGQGGRLLNSGCILSSSVALPCDDPGFVEGYPVFYLQNIWLTNMIVFLLQMNNTETGPVCKQTNSKQIVLSSMSG